MNYGELKAAVQSYLYDRTDLTGSIPTFIELAERRIFRQLRVPANEKIVHFVAHESGSIDLPKDYLEAKILTADSKPLERISDLTHLKAQDKRQASGEPRQFSRIGAQLHLYPRPDTTVDITLVYWYDLSGTLSADIDTNEVLRIAPDVYLHGALVEASAYLGQDSRIGVWKSKLEEGLGSLRQQAVEAEYAGSVVAVKDVYPEWKDHDAY